MSKVTVAVYLDSKKWVELKTAAKELRDVRPQYLAALIINDWIENRAEMMDHFCEILENLKQKEGACQKVKV